VLSYYVIIDNYKKRNVDRIFHTENTTTTITTTSSTTSIVIAIKNNSFTGELEKQQKGNDRQTLIDTH
jgi:hypothetical protein